MPKGKGKNKEEEIQKRTAQKEKISKAVCAILNSGGGLVLVNSADKDYNYNQDGLGLDIEEILSNLLFSSTSKDYYDVIQCQSYILIFVKTWSTQNVSLKLCSLNTGLYIRSFTSKLMANSMQVLDLVEKKTRSKGKRARLSSDTIWQSDLIKHLLDKPYLRLHDKLELSESEHIEFKDFSTGKLESRIKEIINPYFSAFGNGDGGYLIIGVDNYGRITGCGKHCHKSELETCIKEAVSKIKIVHVDCCNSSDEFYKLTIKDVWDTDQKDLGYVIFFEVKPVCCLAFVDDPQSWIFDPVVKEEKRLSASEWITIMTQCPDPSLESKFEHLEIGEKMPLAKTVYKPKGLENLDELQYNLFGSLEEKLTIQPYNLYLELKAEYPELEGLLNTVIANDEGVIILSRSWAVDLEENSNPNVVCDALLLISGKHPKLYSMVIGDISQRDFKYSHDTALTLKKQLVNIGGYTRKLCVIPVVLQLNSENQKPPFSWPDITYPETYKLDGVKEVLQSLLLVMLSFRSYLSDKLGTEYFNLLTMEQYKVLSENFFKGPFFVYGPPGTGKTVVALKIIKKIKNKFNCSPDKILFICENAPLRTYVRDLNICLAVTRWTFERENFSDVEHIVADEAQNFQCEIDNWFEKAKQIVAGAGGRGVFYVFLDNFQSCHKKKTGLPPPEQQNMHILTKVIRSPTKIYNYMFKTMEKIASKQKTPFMKDIIKKSKCCHGVLGLCDVKTKIDMFRIVKHVAKTCKEYLSNGYPQGDIAILCNTENAVDDYRPLLNEEMKRQTRKLRKRLKEFERAENIMLDAIIFDSVRRFSGLERPIVFAINPVCLDPKVDDNVSLCAASRATANVHLYYES
ncbi:schlafen family member 11 [Mantella aurantiaca]